MTDITFDTTESDNGRVLLVKFPYDEDIIDRIKSMPKPTTQWGYHDPDFEDTPLDVDEKVWYITHTQPAINELEQALSVTVPKQYRPKTNATSDIDPDTITLHVTKDSTEFTVEPITDQIRSLLDAEFSYRDPDAQFSDAYQDGHWDGKHHLFDTDTATAPIGFLHDAEQLLNNHDYETTIQWKYKQRGALIDTSWSFEHALRDYQRDATHALIENHGGIVSLPTGTGKTVTALRTIYELNRKSLILVHTRELMYQWAQKTRDILGIEPGIVGDDTWREGPVTIATMQTLMQNSIDDLDDDYGLVAFDECHVTSAADIMHDIGTSLGTYYRLGLSATPWRRVEGETMKIRGAIGQTVHEDSAKDMIRRGYLANPVFDIVDPDNFGTQASAKQNEKYPHAYRKIIELDPARTRTVAASANALAEQGHKVLVNVDRILQGELISWMLNEDTNTSHMYDILDNDDTHRERLLDEALDVLEPIADKNAVMLSSNVPDGTRDTILDEFKNGDRQIVISTLLEEGVDIPDITAIVLAHGKKSDITTIQTIGRALRPTAPYARIVDIADKGRFFRNAHKTRLDTMERYYDLDTEITQDNTPLTAVDDEQTTVQPLHDIIDAHAIENNQRTLTQY